MSGKRYNKQDEEEEKDDTFCHHSWSPFESDDDEGESSSQQQHDETTISSNTDNLLLLPGNRNESSKRNNNNISEFFQWYQTCLRTKPLITKAITSSIIGALGAIISARKYPSTTTFRPNNQNKKNNHGTTIDWVEVISFAIHGGCVAAPLSHYWNRWLLEDGPESRSASMLLDQLIVQPPMLFLMHVFLDMTRAAVREIPNSFSRSRYNIGSTVALSWRLWPVAVYIMLRLFQNKKKQYTWAMNLCSLYWVSRIANKRSLTRQQGED